MFDVICDEQTDDTALDFAEIRIGKPPKNRNECVEWTYNSAEPQNEEETRVVNKNQGWEGGAAVGYKRGPPLGEVSAKVHQSWQWTDEVEEWRTIFSPSDIVRDNYFRIKTEEARTHCNEGEQQTCSWVVCLNKQTRWQRDMYPSTATHCLRKYFAVVLEIKRLEPVEIDGFGPGKTFEPLKDHPKQTSPSNFVYFPKANLESI